MDVKLTLKLDKNVIEKAKIYAAEHHHSLSLLVENYLKAITQKERIINNDEISSFVKSLSIGKGEVPVDFDYKKERQEYLTHKYK